MKLLLQIFKTMEKSEFPVLIKHCFLMEKNTIQAKTLLCQKQWLRGGMLALNAVIQTQMMLNAQITQIWLLSRKTPKKLDKFVWADRKLKLCKIAEELKISESSVFPILHEHLSVRKLCSKWVLRLLTVNQKQQHVNNSVCCLQLF